MSNEKLMLHSGPQKSLDSTAGMLHMTALVFPSALIYKFWCQPQSPSNLAQIKTH